MENNVKYEVVDESNFETQSIPVQGNPNSSINSAVGFEAAVKRYVDKHHPVLYILTPCFGATCFVNYVSSLIVTMNFLKSLNIVVHVEFCKNDSLISRARNNLIAKAMVDKETTHIMFIDNDISWDPISILKLLVSDKDVVGGVYPLKHYHWNKLMKDPLNPYNSNVIQSWVESKNNSQLKNVVDDNDIVQHKLLSYNVNYLNNTLNVEQNLSIVRHIPTGFMMIKRNVIENMFKAFPSTKYVDDVSFLEPEENEFAYALFDCGVEDGHYFSEDWLFCDRWRKMGGDIWIDVTINLTHTGIEDYKGSYISNLM